MSSAVAHSSPWIVVVSVPPLAKAVSDSGRARCGPEEPPPQDQSRRRPAPVKIRCRLHRRRGIYTHAAGYFLYKQANAEAYDMSMDVAVSELRAHLSEWLDRARGGDEVVITDRGVPIARLLGLTATATLERLAADGVIARATAAPRPRAAGQPRPRPRQPIADLVSDQRR